MNITIKTDERDKPLLDGFAMATGWNEKSGVTKEDWLNKQVSQWIEQRARSGFTTSATVAAKSQYVTVIRAAAEQAKVEIPPPVVTAEAAVP